MLVIILIELIILAPSRKSPKIHVAAFPDQVSTDRRVPRLVLPGTVIHELAHLFTAESTQQRTYAGARRAGRNVRTEVSLSHT